MIGVSEVITGTQSNLAKPVGRTLLDLQDVCTWRIHFLGLLRGCPDKGYTIKFCKARRQYTLLDLHVHVYFTVHMPFAPVGLYCKSLAQAHTCKLCFSEKVGLEISTTANLLIRTIMIHLYEEAEK